MNEGLVLFCRECKTPMPTIQIINEIGDSKMIYKKICQPCRHLIQHRDNLRYNN
jgi:hypothetical protein